MHYVIMNSVFITKLDSEKHFLLICVNGDEIN